MMNQTFMSLITCAVLYFSNVYTTEARSRQNLKAPEEALTLSRFNHNGQSHILAVLDDDGKTLTGIDLSVKLNRFDQSALEVIQTLQYNEVVAIIRASKDRVTVPYEALLPAIEGNKHIAIGINYDEHGEETSVDAPFLFPKIVDTDPAIHHLKYTPGWLLDHEVELGLVFPDAVCSNLDLPNQRIGFLVVNDYSERATLMRELDVKNVKNGKGFPNAKSMKGFLPTGPYIVVPRDWQSFVAELTLDLHVNGVIRQSGFAKDMVWNISKIIEETLASKNRTWPCHNKNVGLLENDCIPANSIIITGTPAGVIFKKPTTGFKVKTASKYFLTFSFFSHQLLPYVMQEHLKKQIREDKYLKPGDFVETSISFLGTIKTTIE
ncbi:fumarylacetoacetate hydrolase family protein [Parachryseolinea silvisoli]|uniref:fumarylacetoacetate hydrolase family protein n=1 Tax=Parachryseolinea silvisoli TaxID=2873601 RepID=UPI002265DF68|nr:fumarylacetoacetate hydrolase family protein [Parachryseolinea silvisoli]MCD9017635.1 fumarylacetoacetate hydrolase family protein [Parachryseolinea silvisoli]